MSKHYKPWSVEDDHYLIGNAYRDNAEIAESLGRTEESVHRRRYVLRKGGLLPYKNKPFSSEEDFYIKMSDEPLGVIGEKLGRGLKSIAQRRRQLGVSKKYKTKRS